MYIQYVCVCESVYYYLILLCFVTRVCKRRVIVVGLCVCVCVCLA